MIDAAVPNRDLSTMLAPRSQGTFDNLVNRKCSGTVHRVSRAGVVRAMSANNGFHADLARGLSP